MVHTIRSSADFDKQLSAAGKKLVVVDFYATWCGPCKAIEPTVRDLSKKYADKVVVLKVNVDKFEGICHYYKVSSMPTFLFIKNGRKVAGFSGADERKLTTKIAQMA